MVQGKQAVVIQISFFFFFGTKENIGNFSIISSIFSSCLHANEINKFKEDFSFKFPNDISITSQNSTTPQQQQM